MIAPRLLVALSLALLAAVPATAQNPFAKPGTPVVIGTAHDLPSAVLAETRRINVMLPPGYGEGEARYAVLYLLDGGAAEQDFFHIAGLVHQQSLWGVTVPMIVVGIESRDRRRELTGPSQDAAEQRDFPSHGEAAKFRGFLATELKPAIEAAYRTNGSSALIGESLAGYFVVETALRQPEAFDSYIAISPSLWWNAQQLSREAPALLAAKPQPRRLWLSIADEGGTMQEGMDRLVAALKANAKPALKWRYTRFPDEKHSSIYHPAATKALRELYAPAPEPEKP